MHGVKPMSCLTFVSFDSLLTIPLDICFLIPTSIQDRAPITILYLLAMLGPSVIAATCTGHPNRSLCLLLLHMAVLAFPTFQLCMGHSCIQCLISTLYSLVTKS